MSRNGSRYARSSGNDGGELHNDGMIVGKTCSVCGENKPLAEFGRSARGVGGRRSQCKKCNAAAVKARYVPRVYPPEQVTCP